MEMEVVRVLEVERQKELDKLSEILAAESYIVSGRVYGSFLHKGSGEDLDIALMISSDNGVVKKSSYERLTHLRLSLCQTLDLDVDLVPHTVDEVYEESSPLWNPRYHPSLKFGLDVKNTFPVPERINELQNPSIYVLHDNRTITRRQLLRQNTPENWRIFVAKLIHGPGNALTYLALKNGSEYLTNPSDIEGAFRTFDRVFGVNSQSVITLFSEAKPLIKKGMFTFEHAVTLMTWYESLLGTALGYNPEALYGYLATNKPQLRPESASS